MIAYGKILPKEILDIPKYKSWNAHASLLPRWRGAAPIQWSILNGDEYTGVGDYENGRGFRYRRLINGKKIKIDIKDNLQTLSKKLSDLSSELFFEGNIRDRTKIKIEDINHLLKKQTTFQRELKYARMIKKSDYVISWDK